MEHISRKSLTLTILVAAFSFLPLTVNASPALAGNPRAALSFSLNLVIAARLIFMLSWFMAFADGSWKTFWSARIYFIAIISPLIALFLIFSLRVLQMFIPLFSGDEMAVWNVFFPILQNRAYVILVFVLSAAFGMYGAFRHKRNLLRFSVILAVGAQTTVFILYLSGASYRLSLW